MKRQPPVLDIPVTVKSRQLRATIGRVLRQIKRRCPEDFARLKSRVLAIIPLPEEIADDGTRGFWNTCQFETEGFSWGASCWDAEPSDAGEIAIWEALDEGIQTGVLAHELGHACSTPADLARRRAPAHEWASELAADWYAYRWGFGRDIACNRRHRNVVHHAVGPGQVIDVNVDGVWCRYRVTRNHCMQLIEGPHRTPSAGRPDKSTPRCGIVDGQVVPIGEALCGVRFWEEGPDAERPVESDRFPEKECDVSTGGRECKANTLLWSDVEGQAHCIFDALGGLPEVDRARRVWDCVVAAGLAGYNTAIEETLVKVRLLAIAAIFWERRFGSWKDMYSPVLENGMEDLEIAPFRIGQIAGMDGRLAEQVSGVESQWELLQGVVTALIDADMPVLSEVIDAGHETERRRFVEVCDTLGLPDQTREAVCGRLAEMAQPCAYLRGDDEGEEGLSDTLPAAADGFRGVSEEELLRLAADCARQDEWTKDLRQQYLGHADRVKLMTRGVLEEDDVYPPFFL